MEKWRGQLYASSLTLLFEYCFLKLKLISTQNILIENCIIPSYYYFFWKNYLYSNKLST